jgi:glycosyltransferase involved in cell wall biosynthesis
MRIAYLCNRYPAVSLTFILREVRALRRLGVDVQTFAIRRAFPEHLVSGADREECARTYAVLPPDPRALVLAHLTAAVLHPLRYLGTLALALRLRPRGLRGAVWQGFYFAEAIVIWRECRRRGISHIHAHFANVATDVALLACHFGGGRTGSWSWSFTLHGPVEFYDVTQSRLPEKLRRAQFVVCISDFARSQAMAFLDHEQWGKLHVVHCGVDPDAFRPVRHSNGAVPASNGAVPARELHVLSVGRLIDLKGHALLLEAMAVARAEGVRARLTIVGDGSTRHALEAHAARLGLVDEVTFAGAVGQDEIAGFYADTDIFCLASFAEGVPVVLMEAMAMEIAVIATRIAGIPELVEDGVSGLVVAPGSADRLAAALRTLAYDPALRRAMGRAGRAKVLAEFDVAKSAAQLRELFGSSGASSTLSGSGVAAVAAVGIAADRG